MKKAPSLAVRRPLNQRISDPRNCTAAEAAAGLGALPAQDYLGAKWSIGLRLPGSAQADVDHAVESGEIVRTWLMRGTLHIASASDVGIEPEFFTDSVRPSVATGPRGGKRALPVDD